jgi:ABC-2 type transport system ATP-binding protein
MAMIEVRDLVYDYPTKRALFGVSFDVLPGTITALVGPNGAGKTTLLRCMAALEKPYSGTVRIDGIDTRDDPRAIHERLGYLPDFYGLYDELTVQRSLIFAARAHSLSPAKAEEAAVATAKQVGLGDRLGDRASELSRGLRQRLAIGQAIVHTPKVLLLDEPASGLDPDARRDLSHLLLSLRDKGITLIVSSHILSELEDYASEMLIMDGGRIAGGKQISVAAGEGQTYVRIELAEANARFGELLKAAGEVKVVEAGDTRAMIAMSEDAKARAAVLEALIKGGLKVATFAPERRRLEDAYFNETRKGGAS